jgi:hypothetical protein
LLKFTAFLRDEKKQSPRSVYNKFETGMTFLKNNGFMGWWERTTDLDSRKKSLRYTSGRNWRNCSTSAMRRREEDALRADQDR